jgi:hypothetical protein
MRVAPSLRLWLGWKGRGKGRSPRETGIHHRPLVSLHSGPAYGSSQSWAETSYDCEPKYTSFVPKVISVSCSVTVRRDQLTLSKLYDIPSVLIPMCPAVGWLVSHHPRSIQLLEDKVMGDAQL